MAQMGHHTPLISENSIPCPPYIYYFASLFLKVFISCTEVSNFLTKPTLSTL